MQQGGYGSNNPVVIEEDFANLSPVTVKNRAEVTNLDNANNFILMKQVVKYSNYLVSKEADMCITYQDGHATPRKNPEPEYQSHTGRTNKQRHRQNSIEKVIQATYNLLQRPLLL